LELDLQVLYLGHVVASHRSSAWIYSISSGIWIWWTNVCTKSHQPANWVYKQETARLIYANAMAWL